MSLVPHLCDDLVFFGRLGHGPHLADGARERLLAVHVLAGFHRQDRGGGMGVVGRRDRDGIDPLRFLVEHLAEVFIALRLGVGRVGVGRAHVVHVAQGVDVLDAHAAHVLAAPPADADARDVERVARRANPSPEDVPRHDGEGEAGADVADECPSRDAFACHSLRPL